MSTPTPGAGATNDAARDPALRLGPLLRYAERGRATVWVETSAPCTVEILADGVPAARDRTFTVHGHHYAIVTVTDLPDDTSTPYRVQLDGNDVWPRPGWPESVIRIPARGEPVRIAFGSCLAQGPQEPPWTIHRNDDRRGLGPDALRALALKVRDDPDARPDALLLLGDQVYADSAAPELREWIAQRRDISEPPGDGVADFAEYGELYRRTWSDPTVQWLLSTVPTSMIFDDHEIIDDWNISASWVEDIRRQPWWEARISSGLAAYWIYEHLGNMTPDELAENPTLAAVRAAGDGAEVLLERAGVWDRGTAGTEGIRWSYERHIGDVSILVIDSRNGRILEPGRRRMIDDSEHAWIAEHARQATSHLVLASSVPWLLPSGIHQVEGWNEKVADGAWGPLAARVAEKLRRAIDLEHWAAFRSSWNQLSDIVRGAVCGDATDRPASAIMLSGDVHYSYAARLGFANDVHRPVWQLTSSPLRYPTPSMLERAFDIASTRIGDGIGRVVARLVGLDELRAHWRLEAGPMHHNGVAVLSLDRERAHVRFYAAVGATTPRLQQVDELDLVGGDPLRQPTDAR